MITNKKTVNPKHAFLSTQPRPCPLFFRGQDIVSSRSTIIQYVRPHRWPTEAHRLLIYIIKRRVAPQTHFLILPKI